MAHPHDERDVDSRLREAAALLRAARHAIALTGAGISVESGIPDFRSAGGLWTVFPPQEYAVLSAFRRDPAKVWRLFRAMDETLAGCAPNPAHRALAGLEAAGLLRLVITQNIDGLHQAAGSREVIEIHGDARRLHCIRCGHLQDFPLGRLPEAPPACPFCDGPLKPNVVLFEEAVRDLARIEREVLRCDLLLVVGTSAQVYPAAAIPSAVRSVGGAVLEFNLEETALTAGDEPPEFFFRGRAGETLPRFARAAIEGASPRRTDAGRRQC